MVSIALEEVSAHGVILVDEGDTGDVEGRSLTPNGLRLGLNAGNGVEDGDSAIEDAQAALDLGGEVNVARAVDDRCGSRYRPSSRSTW